MNADVPPEPAPVPGQDGASPRAPSVPPETPPEVPAAPLGAAEAHFAGFAGVALVHLGARAAVAPPGKGAAGIFALAAAFDTGQALALGLLAATGAFALARLLARRAPRPSPRSSRAAALAALAVASMAASYLVLREDFLGPAERNAAWMDPELLGPALAALASLAVPAVAAAGLALARPGWRWAGVVLGLSLAAIHAFLFPTAYPGGHFYAFWVGATLAGTSLLGARPPRRLGALRRGAGRAVALASLVLVALASLAWRPSSAVLFELSKSPTAVLGPFWGELLGAGDFDVVVPADRAAWFRSRKDASPVAPSLPKLLPEDGIVVFVTVDSLRADVLEGDRYRKRLPTLFALRDSGAYFEQARTPGSQTVYTLSSVFSGNYFSQQYWTKKKKDRREHVFPHADDSVRFPALLSEAGVRTSTIATLFWLTNEWGIVRGFEDERFVKGPRKHPPASLVVGAMRERLAAHAKAGKGPLFLYAHLMDPHAPYNSASKEGTPFERYVAEIEVVDRELGGLEEAISELGLAGRTALVVSSDHGEAFGEHNVHRHGTTLYDEVLRVPLLVKLPGGRPVRISEPVSLIDLGPTFLDLFGVPTPGSFLGESLVGFLRGQRPKLTRPLAAEGRLKYAMVFPDGKKAIHDARRGTVELYDLVADPGELSNVFEAAGPEGKVRLDELRTFFDAHRIRRPGYRVPYRP